MALLFSIPAKTFVAGEYLALLGGPALLAATGPCFELFVKEGRGARKGLPSGSPADRFVGKYAAFFSALDLEFRDPYQGAGGWGASTAQFLGVFALASWGKLSNDEAGQDLDLKRLFEEYKDCAWNGEGLPPSGADLIGQLKGGFTWFEKRAGMISRGLWPFTGCELFLLRTGVKVVTHEHLRGLGEFPTAELELRVKELRQAWTAADEGAFARALDGYGKALFRLGFVAPKTQELLKDLSWNSSVLAAKGCGALGADVVAVLVSKPLVRSFQLWCEERGLESVRIADMLSAGLTLKVEGTVTLNEGALT